MRTTNGPPLRDEARCRNRTTTSLPVPDSPSSNTVVSVEASGESEKPPEGVLRGVPDRLDASLARAVAVGQQRVGHIGRGEHVLRDAARVGIEHRDAAVTADPAEAENHRGKDRLAATVRPASSFRDGMSGTVGTVSHNRRDCG